MHSESIPYTQWTPDSFSNAYLTGVSDLPPEETALRLYKHAHDLLMHALTSHGNPILREDISVQIRSYQDEDGWSTLVTFYVPLSLHEALSLNDSWLDSWIDDDNRFEWISSCSFAVTLVGMRS